MPAAARWVRPTVRRIADLHALAVPFAGEPPPTSYDGYWARLVKLIPAEVVGAWVIISGLLEGTIPAGPPAAGKAAPQPAAASPGSLFGISVDEWYWIVFLVFLALSVVYMLLAVDPRGRSARIVHVVAAPIAFAVWVLALGGPFQYQSQQPQSHLSYNKAVASVLLILVSATIPAIDLLIDKAKPATKPSP